MRTPLWSYSQDFIPVNSEGSFPGTAVVIQFEVLRDFSTVGSKNYFLQSNFQGTVVDRISFVWTQRHKYTCEAWILCLLAESIF